MITIAHERRKSMVPIYEKPMPKAKYPLKCPYKMTPTRIVIHNTANDASADNEVSYMQGNLKTGGFHFAVDDKKIIQCSPLDRNTWNATDGNGKGNREGIAIEICYSKSGGDRFEKAQENAAELTAMLLKRYGWGLSQVTKHKDYYNKHCPHRTLDQYGWSYFLDLVEKYLKPASVDAKATYRVRTKKHGWLGAVTDLADYAGWQDSPITDVAIKASHGSVKYRVHVKGGKWLPYVTGYDIKDHANGYAGNGKPIDAIEVIFTRPSGNTERAQYRVAPVGGGYYPWQYNAETGKGQDGYAGAFGKQIGKLQITIE